MIDFTQLKGKTIAITGASSGIGRETARLLGRLGANLVLGSRNEDKLFHLASQITEGEVSCLPLDVTREDSVIDFAERTLFLFGKIDALINSAGTGRFASILDSSTEDFDTIVSVNLRGTYLCCKHFGKSMVRQGFGKVINIVSIAGTTALLGCGAYSASKFGVLGLTRVLQAELRGKGIHVTSVLPGAVDSSFWDSVDHKPDMSLMIPTETLAQHILFLLCQLEGAIVDEITIMPPLGIL